MKLDFRKAVVLTLAGLFAGIVSAAQQPPPVRLSLQEAIQRGLQTNLGVLLAGTRVDEAEGTRLRRLSAALLPRVNAQTYANLQNRNLRAFGISLPGMPEVVGPFSNYDFRVYAQQNVVDFASYRGLKASERALDASKMDERDARDLIVRVIAALYLNAQSAAARVDAALPGKDAKMNRICRKNQKLLSAYVDGMLPEKAKKTFSVLLFRISCCRCLRRGG